jgi:hypothetical protein
MAYPELEGKGPCPQLIFEAGRSWCGFAVKAERNGMNETAQAIAKGLGFGLGCSMDDTSLPKVPD